jgi:RNA polymerase sigma-70 factor (ECF subfamily)
MGVLTFMPRRLPQAPTLIDHLPFDLGKVVPDVAKADQELVQRLARGDEAALRELFTTYGPHAKALAQRIVASPALAEEVVQEVFLSVWRNARDYRPELGSVRAWLFAAVHHRAVDSVRREESFRRRAQEEAVLIPEAGEPDVAELVAESDELALRRKRMRSALEQLPPEQRRVLELMYFEGRTQTAIAQETGLPLGTVKSRTLLGMRRLRKELEGIDVEVDR